jgi:hypothetical protein
VAFKFGLTVVNCPSPSLTDAFYLLATMEAFDTYHNLKKGIFGHVKEELEMLFNRTNEPKLIVVFGKEGKPVLVRIFTLPPKNNPCNDEVTDVTKDTEDSHNSWVRESMDCAFCCSDQNIWGLAVSMKIMMRLLC